MFRSRSHSLIRRSNSRGGVDILPYFTHIAASRLVQNGTSCTGPDHPLGTRGTVPWPTKIMWPTKIFAIFGIIY